MSGGVNDIIARVRAGDRGALARALTLSESRRASDRGLFLSLLEALEGERTAREKDSATDNAKSLGFRLVVVGSPGAGKSSFIEALCSFLLRDGYCPAVLASDPAGALGGGSILADRVCMGSLVLRRDCFVRASPGSVGGLSSGILGSVLLCELAGYDPVIIEPVGGGQEVPLAVELGDVSLLLVSPGGGDIYQAMKRGVLERVDGVVVTKRDSGLEPMVDRVHHAYRVSLSLFEGASRVWSCSSLERSGFADILSFLSLRRSLGLVERLDLRRLGLSRFVEESLVSILGSYARGLGGVRELESRFRGMVLEGSEALSLARIERLAEQELARHKATHTN